jgi:hypothetical protein
MWNVCYSLTFYIFFIHGFDLVQLSKILAVVAELASGDLEKFIPVTIPGPSTSMEDLDIKLEGSRPPSSSHTSLSEDPLSPPSQYYSEEEDEEEESDQDDQADSDLEVN